MYDPAAAKAAEIVLTERLLSFWFLPVCLPAQYPVNRAQLLNMPSIPLDEIVGLAAKTRRLEIVTMLNNFRGHLLCEAGVVIVQHPQRLLVLVFGFTHK